ncbi:MAG: hypothetical protein ACXWLZ_00045 [Rhizomicrobium sp.]
MIQIKAPDGSIVQFPDGTGDDVITGVMAKNYPAPAPDLASLAAGARKDLVEQPGVMEARAPGDLAALEAASGAAEPSFVDRLKSAVGLGPSAPAAPADPNARGVMGTVDQGVRGVAQGIATMAALPVDLGALWYDLYGAGLKKIGAPDAIVNAVHQNPVAKVFDTARQYIGADALKGYLDSANRGTADVLGVERPVEQPQNLPERVTNRIGQEVGAAALPIAGAIGYGAKVGVDAARKLPMLARMFVEPAAVDAGKFAAKEGATAFAAGTGAAGAGEFSHAAGLDEKGGAHATLDILGALAGAGMLGAGRIVGKPIKDVYQAIRAPDKFSNNTVKENVVDRLINNADTLPKVEGQAVDTAPLVDAINRGARVDATIPGFKESIADRTGDSGLAALEYGRQSGQGAGQFTARRAENTAAVDNAMNANAPDGNPAALRAELDLERTRRLTDAGVQTQNANDAFERATQALQPAMTGEGRGANIRAALEAASGGARDILARAWEPINRSGAHVDMAPLAEDFQGVNRSMSTAERERFRPNEATIPQRLSGDREIAPAVTGPNGEVIQPAVTEPITQPISEVTGLRSALTDASREAMTAGRTNEARIINQHVDALDNYLDHAVPPELRQQYDQARAATVDYHDRFTRPQTAIAQTLDRTEGVYRQPNSDVAQKFVQADEGRINDFKALMRETGHDERTVSAVRDQILADVRDRGLLERPDQLREYLGRYNTVLSDPRFAGVRGQLDNAAGLRQSLDTATGAETNLTRELGTPDKAGTSTVGKYLAYDDARSQDALKGIIASKKPGAAMDEALNFVNNKPEAVAGAKKSFWDLMQSKARSNGETTKTMDGAQPWMPNRLKNFLDDPAHKAVAERLYRDDPEQLANIRKIADELQGVDLRARGKAPNTSGTAQGVSNVLTPETLQSRLYAYKRGQTSLGFMLTALGSVAARRLVRGAQGEAMEKLLDKALLEPDLAAQLLKEHNPANRAALARTAKAYLGNEASTVMDLFDEEPTRPFKDDPIKSAIMKKDDNGR